MQSSLNLQEIFDPINESLEQVDDMLGKGAMMPFNNTNSGGRKILFGTQREHVIPVNDAEVAFIQTGVEDEYGKYSSSVKTAKGNYKLIAKVPKFSNMADHHYFAVFINCDTNMIEYEERKCYKHITESYGYMINNEKLDSIKPGNTVPEGTIIQKSVCYDEYNNRKDGLNLNTGYISCARTMEDGILISRSVQKRTVTPLIHHLSIAANGNDIPLNLFGYDDVYKIIPDIGEEVPNGVLIGLRREDKDEILFSQTHSRLKDIMMSDDKYTVEGKIVDINVYCNDPTNISTNPYYSQIKYYYDEDMKFCNNFIEVISSLKEVYSLSYDTQKLYKLCKDKLAGKQYIKDRPFSNVIIDIVLVEQNMIQVGDKLSDRYGGKGVVVGILEDEMMPVLSNGKTIDIIFNKSTCINRLNAGQMFEVEINHIAQRNLEYMQTGVLSTDECIDIYVKFISYCNPEHGDYLKNYFSKLSEIEKEIYIDNLLQSNGIYQSLLPISDSFTLDKLNDLYKEFPWAKQYSVSVPMKNSRGNIVYKKARRPIICGTKYIYRLKQYAREKFSVCSLSATNIKNENTRSKANKMFKGLYPKTPVRFGEMESGNMSHIGTELVVLDLLLYSASPHARRMAGEQILTGDPFNIDVKLDTESKNIGIQALNTLLKTAGLRLVFEKIRKDIKRPIIRSSIFRINEMKPSDLIKPIRRLDPNAYVADDLFDRMYDIEHGENGLIRPIKRYPIVRGSDCKNKYIYSPLDLWEGDK